MDVSQATSSDMHASRHGSVIDRSLRRRERISGTARKISESHPFALMGKKAKVGSTRWDRVGKKMNEERAKKPGSQSLII